MTKLLHGDCLKFLLKIKDKVVNLTVTSPPYDNLRSYNGNNELWSEDVWRRVIQELFRVTKIGGVVVWVVGDATIKGSETGTSFKQALWAMKCGFNLHDTMIYEKYQACFGSRNCYLQSFEYMFIFSKGKPSSLNFIRDRENVQKGIQNITVGGIKKNGTRPKRHRKKLPAFGKRKNIWKYSVGGGKTGHPAVFPEKLAYDHIISWSEEGDIVLDPFMGSGTTRVACKNLNRNFVGIELDKDYFEIAKKRITETEVPNG